MIHQLPVRIYYEDTDAGGVVYHSNYLKYAERARSEFLYASGFTNLRLIERGLGIMIRRCEMDFKAPAKLEDIITVHTKIDSIGGASMVMDQTVKRGDQVLVGMKIHVVFVDPKALKPVRLPTDVREQFEKYVEKE